MRSRALWTVSTLLVTMMTHESSTRPHHGERDELDLVSMYLHSPVGRAHGIAVRLGPERDGTREGVLALDPNHCGIDAWGDRTWCTRIAIRTVDVTATRTSTQDPAGHRRVLHRLASAGFENESLSLIEYPQAGLWYLLYEQTEGGAWVVPLFPAGIFEAEPPPT